MDIDLLSKMVKELILDNDEVSLPGIGTFVTEIVPAVFSDKGFAINPPYRRLFFRERPAADDGLLVGLYSSSNGSDVARSTLIITDFLTEMKEVLLQRKTLILPGLGRLRATRENNIFFVADEDLDIWPEGLGLERVSLKSHVESVGEVSAALQGLRSMMDAPAAPAPVPVSEAIDVPAEVEPVFEEPAEAVAAVEAIDVVEAVAEVEPLADPEPAAEPIEAEPTPEPVATAKPIEADPAPAAEPIPAAAETPAPLRDEPEAPAPLHAEPAASSEAPAPLQETPAPHAEVPSSGLPLWARIALWLLVAALLLAAALFVLGRVAPDLIDRLLYSGDELELIRQGTLK